MCLAFQSWSPFRRALQLFAGLLVLCAGIPGAHSQEVAPPPPSFFGVLPEPALDHPVIRRLVSPVAPSTPGALLHLPIAFKGAGFAGSATLHVVLRYEGGAGVADVEHDGTTVAGSTFQGLVDVPDTIQLSADTRPGWYAVLVSMVRGGQGIACIPARGVTEVQTHVYQVGEVLVHNALDRDGLSLWTFDEPAGSTVFADALNVRWPLMFTTTTTPTPGVSTPYGRGLRFSGTNVTPQTLTVPREMVPGPQFTAGFWFSLQRTSMLASILVSGVYAQDGFRMGLVPRGTNLLVGAWATQSGGTFELLSTNGIRTNEWHHLAFAYDGTLGVLYLDGRRAATPTNGTVIPAAAGGLTLQGGSSTPQQTFQGLVDEFFLTPAVLGDDSISYMVANYARTGTLAGTDGGSAPVVATIPDVTVLAGRPLVVPVPVFDVDYDLDTLTSDSLPSGATLDPVRRVFAWTPGFNQDGAYAVDLQVTDRAGHATHQAFNITVLPARGPSLDALFQYSIPSTQSPATQPLLIQILAGAPWGIGREGIPVMLAHATDPSASLRILGMRGELMYQGPFGVMPLLPVGHYFVETPGDRTQLLILPADYAGSSFMGAMGDAPEDLEAQGRMALIRPAWRRLGTQVTWDDIEATRGAYNWGRFDAWIAANRTNGARVVIILMDSMPAWLRGTTEANLVTQITRYATDYVRRNRGKFDVLEPFNEPGMDSSKIGSVQGLVSTDFEHAARILNSCYVSVAQAARAQLGNTAPLAGPTWQGLGSPFDQIQTYMGIGGFASSITAGDFHDYVLGRRAPDGQASGGFYNLSQAVQIVRNNTTNAPFFVSEIGLHGVSALGYDVDPSFAALEPYGVTGLSWWLGYRRAVVSTVMYNGAGATAVLPHDFNLAYGIEICGRDPGPSGRDRGFKPQASAFILTCYWLDRATPVSQTVKQGRLYAYSLLRPNGESLVFAWTPEGGSLPIDATRRATLLQGGAVRVHDVFGREFVPSTFGEEPVLFRSSTLSPADLATAVLGLENASCNNIIEPPAEECDCNNLGGATCASLGYGAGILRCSGTNTFDFSGCQFSDPHTLLTAYYPFDELSGTNVADLSGHNLNGLLQTPYLSVSWTNSTRGRVLHFEGVPTPTPQERLFLPNRSFQILPGAGQPFTIALWVRPGARATSRYMGIMACENYGTNGFRLGILPTGQISWWTSQNTGNIELKTPSPVSTNTWHHLAVTYESTRARLFLDGALAFETSNTGYVPTAGDIRLGDAIDGDPVDPFKGEMDDLRFYSRVLTASEVARLLSQ